MREIAAVRFCGECGSSAQFVAVWGAALVGRGESASCPPRRRPRRRRCAAAIMLRRVTPALSACVRHQQKNPEPQSSALRIYDLTINFSFCICSSRPCGKWPARPRPRVIPGF